MVLRAFEDPEVPGDTSPIDALATLELELVLADMTTVETQLDKRRRAAKSDKSLAGEIAAMEIAPSIFPPASLCTGRALMPMTGELSRACSSSPTSPCSPWSTWARISWTDPMSSPGP